MLRWRPGGPAHRDVVEFLVIVVTEQLGGLDLQGTRLEAHTRSRHGDAVLVGEVLDGLHIGVVGQQVVGHRTQRGDGLDVLLALGAVPDGQHRRHACRHHIQRAGQQRFVHCRGAGDAVPVNLDVQALLLAVLFDQFLIAHHVEDQVADTELLGDADLAFRLRTTAEQGTEQAQSV